MRNKITNVLFPYLILISLAIIYTCFLDKSPYNGSHLLGFTSINTLADKIKLILAYYVTGRAMVAYWYIPFIMIIFCGSGIFIKYIELNLPKKLIIYLISLLVAIFVHRSFGEVSSLHMVLYFTNFYLLGILCAQYYDKLIIILAPYKLLFLGLIIGLAGYQAFGLNLSGNYEKSNIFVYAGVDLMVFQKVAICFLFLACAAFLETKKWKGLAVLAESSFAIYFLHPWAILLLGPRVRKLGIDNDFMVWAVYSLFFLGVVAMSYYVAAFIKSRLGPLSRRVIGW